MKYKCLIVDHDDTLVNSTEEVHYPCMLEYLEKHRPESVITLDEFNEINFDPGFQGYVDNILCLSAEERKIQLNSWRDWTALHRPTFFPNVKEVLWKFKENGGIIVVSSHSEKDVILKDYENGGLPIPDAIYGWELPPEKRKPSTYTIKKIKETFGISEKNMIMIDDMKHGLVMCRNSGVDFIFADFISKPKTIKDYMQENSTYTAKNMLEVAKILGV